MCFYGCVGLTNYKDIPVAWGGAPTTTFVFASSQGKTISNSSLECSAPFKKIKENQYEVYASDGDTVTFTFKCDNHENYSDSYIVAGTRTQKYSVTYIPLRKIRVKVYNQEIYPVGAQITIDGNIYTTDTEGYVYIRSGKAVSGSVAATSYAGNTFTFAAIIGDTTNTVEVYAAVEVKFIIKDNFGNWVEGATISCNSKSAKTNLYGEATLLIEKGTFDYMISGQYHFNYLGVVNVGTSASTVQVVLKFNPEPLRPYENGNIQMLIVGNECKIRIIASSGTTDHNINWGDGNITNAISWDSDYTHTYKDNGIHQIEIENCIKVTYCNTQKDNLVSYWSVGNSKVNNLKFESFTKLTSIGLIFKNDVNRTSFKSCFRYCTNLFFIPSGLFDNCPEVLDFSACFSRCTNLISIPLDLFNNCLNVKYFDDSSQEDGCFYSCSKVEILPELWKLYFGKEVVSNKCFLDCTNASNWQEVPASWGGQGPDWYPPFDATITIKLFKDSVWWLNQSVTLNGIPFTQLANGNYSAHILGIKANEALEVSVNGSPQGYIIPEYNKVDYLFSIGDSSGLYSGLYQDYTTGNISEDWIISNNGWTYDVEVGGFRSENIKHGGTTSLTINVPASQIYIQYGQESEVNCDYCSIYNGDESKIIDLKTTMHQGLSLTTEVTSTGNLKFTYHKDNNTSIGKDAFWIKRITGALAVPPLPENFIPTTSTTMSSPADLEQRLARLEQMLNLNNTDYADVQ